MPHLLYGKSYFYLIIIINGKSYLLEKEKILSADDVSNIYRTFARHFLESYNSTESVAIVGMQTRGVQIGRRVQKQIKETTGQEIDFGALDVTFYRDDFRTKLKMPHVQVTEIPFDLYERDIILVDDVLFTGRTVRSALNALMDYGRPRSIKFCCMVDRGHRELPIAADFTGIKINTKANEEVRVKVKELDGEDAVYKVVLDQKNNS